MSDSLFRGAVASAVRTCFFVAAICLGARASSAGTTPTRVVQQNGRWILLRDGQPYEIKGAGGSGSRGLLKQMGGNSVRTWGAEASLGQQLDEAQRLGISVCVGIWLAEERTKGLNYNDPADLSKQAERVRETVLKYKGYPAVLIWGVGKVAEASTDALPDSIAAASHSDVELHMPRKPGVYRLYAFARDDQNNAAAANVSLLVQMGTAAPADAPDMQNDAAPDPNPKPATQHAADAAPVAVLYGPEGNVSGYIPSGWMGNTGAITLDEKCTTSPHEGMYCIKAQFKAADNYGGVVWQNPANNWGDLSGGKDLSKAKKVTFWARGENGGETVQFKFGLIGPDKKFADTGSGDTTVTLTKEWTQYSIDASGKDLSRIVTGFCWVVAGQGTPVTFYLDNIQYQ